MEFKRNVLLKNFTTFKTGGPAKYFCVPKNKSELKESLAFAKNNRLPVSVIGAGSNLLVSDRGYKGLMIHISDKFEGIELNSRQKYHLVKVGAGIRLQKLVRFLSEKGIIGLEFMAGIPGTVGGAAVMNAGAWGEEISNFIKEVKVFDRNGKEKVFKRRDLKFGYRRSKLADNRWIVAEVIFKLQKGKKKEIESKIKGYLGARKKKQPLRLPNFGSVFINPTGFSAGKLIEDAGCKGLQIGGAEVSRTHANFIVNLGKAKTKDALGLISAVQAKVKEKFNILLEPEVIIMVD
jgi:UDP-N-acetylmuramate dehydrogenase